jgi:hypothetical protein
MRSNGGASSAFHIQNSPNLLRSWLKKCKRKNPQKMSKRAFNECVNLAKYQLYVVFSGREPSLSLQAPDGTYVFVEKYRAKIFYEFKGDVFTLKDIRFED